MSLTASDSGGGDYEQTPQGVYTARCYRIIDLGTQKTSGQYGDKEQHKVMVSWELLSEPFMQEGENKGKPFSIHKRYTVSLGEKANLRADLEAWRGKKFTADELKGFDLDKVLGSFCTIQVVHDETGKYSNVNSIMAYKGDKPAAVNPDVVFDIDKPDMKIFDNLSDNLKATIQQAPEWASTKSEMKPSKEADDVVITDIGDEPINLADIPF